MFCPKCGSQLSDVAAFCPICGNSVTPPQGTYQAPPQQNWQADPFQRQTEPVPQPAPEPKKNQKHWPSGTKKGQWTTRGVALVAALALVLGAGLSIGILTLTGRANWTVPGGMKDPDKLVNTYLDRLLAGDVEGVIALCDLPGQMERIDIDSHLERMGAFTQYNLLPNNEATRTIRVNQDENSYGNNISTLYALLLAPESEVAMKMAEPPGNVFLDDFEQSQINEFFREYAGRSLRDVQVVSIIQVEMDREERQRMLENWHELYGSEDYLEYIYLLERNGHYFAGGVALEQAGGVWNIKNMNTFYADISRRGAVWLEDLDGMSIREARQVFVEQYQRATD